MLMFLMFLLFFIFSLQTAIHIPRRTAEAFDNQLKSISAFHERTSSE